MKPIRTLTTLALAALATTAYLVINPPYCHKNDDTEQDLTRTSIEHDSDGNIIEAFQRDNEGNKTYFEFRYCSDGNLVEKKVRKCKRKDFSEVCVGEDLAFICDGRIHQIDHYTKDVGRYSKQLFIYNYRNEQEWQVIYDYQKGDIVKTTEIPRGDPCIGTLVTDHRSFTRTITRPTYCESENE